MPFVEFMLRIIRDTIQDVTDEQINEHLNEQIDTRQQQLVAILKKSPASTIPKLAEQMDCSVATVRRDLAHLQKLGIVRREGSRKAGTWTVV